MFEKVETKVAVKSIRSRVSDVEMAVRLGHDLHYGLEIQLQ